MDLVLWRHAEAQETAPDGDDLLRPLTPRGERQAARMAAWLDRQLPDGARVLVSPALRARQTAEALDRKHKLCRELAPGTSPSDLLRLVGWPEGRSPVLVVGHQPTLGQTIGGLLGLPEHECAVRKGAVWWLRWRERHGQPQVVVVTVQTPDLM